MKSKRKNRGNAPLFLSTMTLVILVCFLLLFLALVMTMRYSLNTLQQKIDDILFSTVYTLSDSPQVQRMVRSGCLSEEMIDYLDNVVAYTDDLDYITIADTDSIRLYHIDHSCIGLPFEGGDQYRALAGECYQSDAEGSFGLQHRAFAPVRDSDGTIIGFVMASASHSRLEDLADDIKQSFFHLFLILSGCALAALLILAAYLNRLFHGARLRDLPRLFLTQNDVLNALDEGLISLDGSGHICLVNQAAMQMLGLVDEPLGVHIDTVLRAIDGGTLYQNAGRDIAVSQPNILVNSILLSHSSSQTRQMLIVQDRSELVRQAQQLNGTRHIVTALRANNHEFLNKLQVLSGLLQMGQTDEALRYIGTLSSLHAQTITPVMQLIHNPSVAALILGKASNTRELNISLTLLQNSYLPQHSRYLSTDELITIVGNLLENAIEAVDALPTDALRAISLQLTESGNGLLIVVSDSGIGMDEALASRIFDQEFSTKATEGRGVGMSLIRGIVERRGGSIELDTEPGRGTIFTLIFNQDRGGINTWSV